MYLYGTSNTSLFLSRCLDFSQPCFDIYFYLAILVKEHAHEKTHVVLMQLDYSVIEQRVLR